MFVLLLAETADVVIDQLEEKSKAVSLTQLAAFVVALPGIRRDMIRMQEITGYLRINASQLNDGKSINFNLRSIFVKKNIMTGLRGVKRELLTSLTKCPAKSCKDVLENYQIGNLNINGIDYNQVRFDYFVILSVLSFIVGVYAATLSHCIFICL